MDASPMNRNFYQHHNIHKRSPSPTIRLPLIDPRVKLIKTAAVVGAGATLAAASALPAGTFALGTLSFGR